MQTKTTLILFFCALLAGCAGSQQVNPGQQALANWNGTRAAVLMGLARDQYSAGNFDQCRQTLIEAMRMEPKDAAIRVMSAKVYIEQGQFETAEQELKLARDLDDKLADVDYLCGIIYQRWQQPDKALGYYDAACEKAPSNLAYLMAKGETLVAMGRHAEALELLQAKVVYFEHSPVIRDAVGMLLLQEGKPQAATDMLREASILSSDDLGIREHLALAEFQAKQYVEAADQLDRLVKEKTLANRDDLYQMLAECQLATGRAATARGTAQTACDLNPSSATAWLTLAKISLELGDLHRAAIGLDQTLQMDPNNGQARLLMGYLCLRQNKFGEALDNFNQAAKIDPTDSTSLCMSGYALQKLDRRQEATDRYKQALKVDPTDDLAGKLMADVESR